MTNSSKWLIAVVVLFSPMGVVAQTNDAAYCQALSKEYQKYYVKLNGHEIKPGPIDGNIAVDQCKAGNTAPAIPVLEKKLRDAKVNLPSRG